VTADTTISDLGPAPEDDAAPTQDQRIDQLAEELCGLYDFVPLAELEITDPERASEHRLASHGLAKWLAQAPQRERKASFDRGWERAAQRRNQRMERRIAELEDVIAALSPREDPDPSPSAEPWRRAREDPRYAAVRREAVQLDHHDGTMVIPYPLQELLAIRVMTAILDAEQAAARP
jgi:hypothetical protein